MKRDLWIDLCRSNAHFCLESASDNDLKGTRQIVGDSQLEHPVLFAHISLQATTVAVSPSGSVPPQSLWAPPQCTKMLFNYGAAAGVVCIVRVAVVVVVVVSRWHTSPENCRNIQKTENRKQKNEERRMRNEEGRRRRNTEMKYAHFSTLVEKESRLRERDTQGEWQREREK